MLILFQNNFPKLHVPESSTDCLLGALGTEMYSRDVGY